MLLAELFTTQVHVLAATVASCMHTVQYAYCTVFLISVFLFVCRSWNRCVASFPRWVSLHRTRRRCECTCWSRSCLHSNTLRSSSCSCTFHMLAASVSSRPLQANFSVIEWVYFKSYEYDLIFSKFMIFLVQNFRLFDDILNSRKFVPKK